MRSMGVKTYISKRSRSKMNVPCAGCKLLRRRCTKECIFVPYFPATEPEKFAVVHRIFGASNVGKMLQDIPVNQREDAVSSMVYEAYARLKDPVYGCLAAISSLQLQISELQSELAMSQAETINLRSQLTEALSIFSHPTSTNTLEDLSFHISSPLVQGYNFQQPVIPLPPHPMDCSENFLLQV